MEKIPISFRVCLLIESSAGQKNRIGKISTTSIVVANMTGAGIFTSSGLKTGNLSNPTWLPLFRLFGDLIAEAGAMCYAEWAAHMPHDDGEYLFCNTSAHGVELFKNTNGNQVYRTC
jgi:amino acid transporter